MPYETVQYLQVDTDSGTEISVHWTKDNYVQLKIERHELVPVAMAYDDCKDTPPVPAGLPVGTVKAADTQIAYKIRAAVDDGDQGEAAEWVVVRLSGAVERCFEEQISEWPVVHYPEDSGRVPSSLVWSETLTRSEINRMIKVLRRARDDVFEADA